MKVNEVPLTKHIPHATHANILNFESGMVLYISKFIKFYDVDPMGHTYINDIDPCSATNMLSHHIIIQ